jgi:protein disulfide-isomerase A6
VNVGAVDMTTDGKAGERYKVQGFPTIKFFGRDKETPYDYSSGDRTYEKFVNYSLAKVKGEISSRIKQI